MPAVETFKNIPELFEGTFEESLKVRSETLSTFKHLGPDDLVHVVKNIPNSRQHIKEVSSYHFVCGVDTSSSASIAAYINSLTYSLESQQKWFKSPSFGNSWNISKCTFCAFNAFEGTDVRVEARIPGGVKSFVLDVLGSRKGTDSDCWQETFISSILRNLRDCIDLGIYDNSANEDDDDSFRCAKRRLDGLFTLQTEMKFLETATKLFYKGRQLGTPRGPHLAGNHDNYLTLAVVGYFCLTGRPEISIGFLKPFIEKDKLLKSLMMKCLLLANNQSLALKSISSDSCAYDELALFLMSRGEFIKAEHFASEALKFNPNNFDNWKRLIQIKILLEKTDEALIILNNSPMITSTVNGDGEFYKNLPKPVLISLPGHVTDKIQQSQTPTPSQSQIILEKLKATSLKGTFKVAYELLIEIYKSIGWDSLLESRTRVFVMEREYHGTGGDEDSKDNADNGGFGLKSPINEPSLTTLCLPDSNFLKKTGKKLCERWLDNLILILFEDLRIFTLFSEELKQQTGTGSSCGLINRNLKEWYLLAELSKRLEHFEEAKLAYQKCLFNADSNSSTFQQDKMIKSSLTSLIEIYCKEGKSQLAVLCTLRLINQTDPAASLNHPSRVTLSLCSLIEKIGLKRVEADLRASCTGSANTTTNNNNNNNNSSSSNSSNYKLEDFFKFLKNAKIHGYDM